MDVHPRGSSDCRRSLRRRASSPDCAVETLRATEEQDKAVEQRSADAADRFDEIATYLAEIDVDAFWDAATDTERRVLIDELIEAVDATTISKSPYEAQPSSVSRWRRLVGRRGEPESCRRAAVAECDWRIKPSDRS